MKVNYRSDFQSFGSTYLKHLRCRVLTVTASTNQLADSHGEGGRDRVKE